MYRICRTFIHGTAEVLVQDLGSNMYPTRPDPTNSNRVDASQAALTLLSVSGSSVTL